MASVVGQDLHQVAVVVHLIAIYYNGNTLYLIKYRRKSFFHFSAFW